MIGREGRSGCKGDYAAICKHEYAICRRKITPEKQNNLRNIVHKKGIVRQKGVDKGAVSDIIKLAFELLSEGGAHDHTRRFKKRSSSEPRSPTPSPRGCERRVVLRKRILRSSRHRPGQVRDASSCFGGWAPYHADSQGVWLFPSSVLSSSNSLQEQRFARINPETARSQACLQTFRGSHVLHMSAGRRRQITSCASSGRNGVEQIWNFNPSPEHRTCVAADEKKRAIENESNSCRIPSASIEEWRVRYEDLRLRYLKQGVPLNRGWGLSLFISQGLVAWIKAWPSKPPIPPSSSSNENSGALECPAALRGKFIILLANMVSSH